MQRLRWLAIPFGYGFLLAIGLLWLVAIQAAEVRAEPHEMHSGAVLYVSTQGKDAGNDCLSSTTPCQTVQHSIKVAQVGDYIHVAGGTYRGSMFESELGMGVTATVIITKEINSVLGGYSPDFSIRDIDTYETRLDASGVPGAHVTVLANTNVRFGGFTLTGGNGAYSPEHLYYPGGAMRVFGGSPTISDNKIINNQAYRKGGGIYAGRGTTASIVNNTIISNSVITLGGGDTSDGGGIYVASGPVLIQGNTILSNIAREDGGGIYIGWNVEATIISNTIAYNRLLDPFDGQGAGIYTIGDNLQVVIRGNHIYANSLIGGFEGSGLYISSPTIIDGNWIEDNYAPIEGSALCITDVTAPVTITNNIIVKNGGIGVRLINNQNLRLFNNTIAMNSYRGVQVSFPEADPIGLATFTLLNNIVASNGECGIYIENEGMQVLDYNDVVGQRYQYCGFPDILDHNLSINPTFVNPAAGDFHLLPGSPAINYGNRAFTPLIDYDGTQRSLYYQVDMGALEFVYLRVFLPITQKLIPTLDP